MFGVLYCLVSLTIPFIETSCPSDEEKSTERVSTRCYLCNRIDCVAFGFSVGSFSCIHCIGKL